MKLKKIKILDSHVHIGLALGADKLLAIMDGCGDSAMNALSLNCLHDYGFIQNELMMLLKARYPGRFYAFGQLEHHVRGVPAPGRDFAEQAMRLSELGFDGMKMIEGKPGPYRDFGGPLDSEKYRGFFRYLEKRGMPLTFHVADPEENWDRSKITEFAIKHGWGYVDGSYPQKEQLYTETENILKKHPRLKVVFAHFYFLSADLERAARFLDKWKNVSFDLTPGWEMYGGFSSRPAEWRKFFVKYSRRIIFGTDTFCAIFGDTGKGAGANWVDDANTVRKFLEFDGDLTRPLTGQAIKGIRLPKPALDNIYRLNFQRFAGKAPKKLNLNLALEECEMRRALVEKHPDRRRLMPELNKIIGGIRRAAQ